MNSSFLFNPTITLITDIILNKHVKNWFRFNKEKGFLYG
jgi:hypothetical protein